MFTSRKQNIIAVPVLESHKHTQPSICKTQRYVHIWWEGEWELRLDSRAQPLQQYCDPISLVSFWFLWEHFFNFLTIYHVIEWEFYIFTIFLSIFHVIQLEFGIFIIFLSIFHVIQWDISIFLFFFASFPCYSTRNLHFVIFPCYLMGI